MLNYIRHMYKLVIRLKINHHNKRGMLKMMVPAKCCFGTPRGTSSTVSNKAKALNTMRHATNDSWEMSIHTLFWFKYS